MHKKTPAMELVSIEYLRDDGPNAILDYPGPLMRIAEISLEAKNNLFAVEADTASTETTLNQCPPALIPKPQQRAEKSNGAAATLDADEVSVLWIACTNTTSNAGDELPALEGTYTG